jgi:hypothetical protein
MLNKHSSISHTERSGQQTTAPALGLADPAVPMRACCCPARPMVKVMMPPTASRPNPVDLWLCGHHFRISRQALAVTGARCYPLTMPRDGQPAAAMLTSAR